MRITIARVTNAAEIGTDAPAIVQACRWRTRRGMPAVRPCCVMMRRA